MPRIIEKVIMSDKNQGMGTKLLEYIFMQIIKVGLL